MPQYENPGVYVEEVSFRARSIEGVSTDTAAFVGPTRRGPVGAVPEPLHSPADFERIYGGPEDLQLADIGVPSLRLNFVALSVRAYFDNGGRTLYVARTARDAASASGVLKEAEDEAHRATLRAPFPGAAYNGRVLLREVGVPVTVAALGAAPVGSLLAVADAAGVETLYVGSGNAWADAAGVALDLAGVGAEAHLLTLTVEYSASDEAPLAWSRVGFAATHPRWLGTVMGTPLRVEIGSAVDAFALLAAVRALPWVAAGDPAGRRVVALAGGSDGASPLAGHSDTPGSYAAALALLADVDGISTVAAPGSSAWPDGPAIRAALVDHVARPGSGCFAVLDGPPGQTPTEVRALRATLETPHAALYYPWVVVADAIVLPPSGFVAGIFARSDNARGVHRAPANEAVQGARRFERDISLGELELLNPAGVNCLRFLPGRGLRVWGARTASSDPEWKYVNVRRLMNYLALSIERGTRWTVFERDGDALRASVRRVIGDFLMTAWRAGMLQGVRPEDGFFVHCDDSTTTQNDVDNGRLVAMVGVAVLRPAEFVILPIARWTADAKPP
ncbi:MAG: phage tail sheath family protein [Comamonadaceae bacterium]|nr:MAG: phage tail sheath family protein [Comamonadaceae bacterium]